MDLGQALLAASIAPETGLDVFSRELDLDDIRRALEATGTATIRRRKLPAEHVVWIVVGMGLFRDRPIQAVVRHLNLVLPDAKRPGGLGRITGGAVVQARDRLGSEPLAVLFGDTADNWATASADKHRWRGLVVHGLDGSTLRIPDTEENEAAFGRPGASRGRSAYPQVRIVALMVLRSHISPRLHTLSRQRDRRALPRALGIGAGIRRDQDAHARPRGSAAQPCTRTHPTGTLGSRYRLQPRPAGDGARRTAYRPAPVPDQLQSLAPDDPQLLARRMASRNRKSTATPRYPPRGCRSQRAAAAATAPLSQGGQDQDEQLRPKPGGPKVNGIGARGALINNLDITMDGDRWCSSRPDAGCVAGALPRAT